MVMTGTDPERGNHGGDVHFKEDAAVFICVCIQGRVARREKIWHFSIFVCLHFLLVYYMRVCLPAYSCFSAAVCNGVCSLTFVLEQNM